MTKNRIKPSSYLFPRPVVLIGANVNGKPNFEPLAYVSSIEDKPPLISIASYETHFTNIGIKGTVVKGQIRLLRVAAPGTLLRSNLRTA